jgi:hypothetical protein
MPTKKDKTPLKMTPPEEIDDFEKARENFLSEPEKKKKTAHVHSNETESSQNPELPWENANVNNRVIKTFNLRFTEPDFLKLKFVVENSNEKSMHSFCANIIKNEIEKRLKKMT